MLKNLFTYCLLLLLSGQATGQANDNAYDKALDTCIEQQFNEQDAAKLNDPLDLIEDCPELSLLLTDQEAPGFINPALEGKTSLNRLLDERFLRQRPYSPSHQTITNLAQVKQLANNFTFDSAEIETPGWWDRFKQWLKERYGSDEQDSGIDWLIELLDGFSFPDWLGDTLYYFSIGLIILLAIFIVVNELRHYKRFQNRDEDFSSDANINPLHQLRSLSWDEVQALPLNDKAAALLQYLIQQCINLEWLPDNKSYTNREFYRELKSVDQVKAQQFNEVINAAEQDIYGNHPLEAEQVNKLLLLTEQILRKDEAPVS